MRILDELGAGAERIRRETIRAARRHAGRRRRCTFGASPPPFPDALRGAHPSRAQLVTAWVLGAATLGAGILVGWAIWG